MKKYKGGWAIIIAAVIFSLVLPLNMRFFRKALTVFYPDRMTPAPHVRTEDPGGFRELAARGIEIPAGESSQKNSLFAAYTGGETMSSVSAAESPEVKAEESPSPTPTEEPGSASINESTPPPVTEPEEIEDTEGYPTEGSKSDAATDEEIGPEEEMPDAADGQEDAEEPKGTEEPDYTESSVPEYADIPSDMEGGEIFTDDPPAKEAEVKDRDKARTGNKEAAGAGGVVLTYAMVNGGGATQWYTEKSGASHSVLAKKRGSAAAYCADPHASFPSGGEWSADDGSGKNKLYTAYTYVLANGFRTFSTYSASEFREYFITQFAMWEVQSHYKDGTNNHNGYVTLDGLSFGSNNYGGSTSGMKSAAQSLADEATAFAESAPKALYGYAEEPTLTFSPSSTKLTLNADGTYYESGVIAIKTSGAAGEIKDLTPDDSDARVFDRTKTQFRVRYPASKVTEKKDFKITASVNWSLKKATVHEPVAFGNSAKPQPVVYLETVDETFEKAAELQVTVEPEEVYLLLKKGPKTSSAAFVSGNPLYSLEGTTYKVFKNDGSEAGSLVTDASGSVPDANAVRLMPGSSYTMKETKAGKGYRTDQRVWNIAVDKSGDITVSAGGVRRTVTKNGRVYTVQMENEPVGANGELHAVKEMKLTDGSTEHVPLSGAGYELKYYASDTSSGTPVFTLRAESDTDGNIVFQSEKKIDGTSMFPLGTITVKEVKAPSHMRLDPKEYKAHIVQKGDSAVLSWEDGGDLLFVPAEKEGSAVTFYNEGKFGGVSIRKKDAETDREEPQGGADFGGITFTIKRTGEGTTWDRTGHAYHNGDTVMSITTEAVSESAGGNVYGYASTKADELMEGEYTIEETSDSEIYKMTDGAPIPFTVTEEGTVLFAGAVKNKVARGGFVFEKRDLEIGKPIPLGGASLSGIEFTLTNESAHAVMIFDELHPKGLIVEPGEVIPAPEGKGVFITDEKGRIESPPDYLPVGTYKIEETKSNESYNLTESSPVTFSVSREGQVAGSGEEDALYMEDQVVRGELHFRKKDENGRLMPGIPFLITQVETGDSRRVYTDQNGEYHSKDVWFGLSRDGSLSAKENDSKKPFVYGWYRIEEERCDANKGKELITDEFMLYEEGQIVDLGTLINKDISIATSAKEETSGTQVFPAGQKGRIIDKVSYEGLDTSLTYILRGELHLKAKGADGSVRDAGIIRGSDGAGITAEKTFTPKTGSGSTDIAFDVSCALQKGAETVVYETLYEIRNGKKIPVAEHRDPSDTGQSIRFIETKKEERKKDTKKTGGVTKKPDKEKKDKAKENKGTDKKRTSPVKTGDAGAAGVFLILMILAGAVLGVRIRRLRTKR